MLRIANIFLYLSLIYPLIQSSLHVHNVRIITVMRVCQTQFEPFRGLGLKKGLKCPWWPLRIRAPSLGMENYKEKGELATQRPPACASRMKITWTNKEMTGFLAHVLVEKQNWKNLNLKHIQCGRFDSRRGIESESFNSKAAQAVAFFHTRTLKELTSTTWTWICCICGE